MSVRLDATSKAALTQLEATGLSSSEAVRRSLVAAAHRLQDQSNLRAEAASLAADVDDRTEAAQVAEIMEELRESR